VNILQKVSRNRSVSIAGGRGSAVRVAQGRVWLTQDGDARDYVLSAGESMNVETRGRAVIFGLTEALVQVDTPDRAPGLWSGLLARLIYQ
jgi:Protein of unknown function (DUF2917)